MEEAKKEDKGKPRYDLIPGDALHEVVKAISMGAEKYDDRNWELGQPWGKVFGAMMRHCWVWWRGEEIDPESKIHHLAHVGANVLFLLAYALRKVGEDDRKLKAEGEVIEYETDSHLNCLTKCPFHTVIKVGSWHCTTMCKSRGGQNDDSSIICKHKGGTQ